MQYGGDGTWENPMGWYTHTEPISFSIIGSKDNLAFRWIASGTKQIIEIPINAKFYEGTQTWGLYNSQDYGSRYSFYGDGFRISPNIYEITIRDVTPSSPVEVGDVRIWTIINN